jgi:Polyketide synthase modules and related proteins
LAKYFNDEHKGRFLRYLNIESVESREAEKSVSEDVPTADIEKDVVREEENYSIEIGDKKIDDGKGGSQGADRDGIAIIGVSGRYPLASNLEEFWDNLKRGRDCITEIPADRWDWRTYYDSNKERVGKTYSKWGGFIDEVDKFDPLFFNISPREAEIMDPQERIF